MSRQTNDISIEVERDPLHEIEVVMKKIHRKFQHINFLKTTRENDVFPKFTSISLKVVRQLKLKKPEILKKRRIILNSALLEHETTQVILQNKKTELFLTLKSQLDEETIHKNISIIKSKNIKFETPKDVKRSAK